MIRSNELNRSTLIKEYVPPFKGKSAIYNEAILMSLFKKGPIKEWALSKEVANVISSDKDEHDVYSVLIRKNGRLEDLESKGYIQYDKSEKKYELTFKGFITLGLVKPTLREDILLDDKFQKIQAVQREDLGFKTPEQLFLSKKEQEEYIKFFNQIKFLLREFFWIILEPYIQNGRINLDIFRNEDLSSWYEDEINNLFFSPRKIQMYQISVRDLILKEISKNPKAKMALSKHRKILQKLMVELSKFYERQANSLK